jgi:hypothetical protein
MSSLLAFDFSLDDYMRELISEHPTWTRTDEFSFCSLFSRLRVAANLAFLLDKDCNFPKNLCRLIMPYSIKCPFQSLRSADITP